MKNYKLRGTKLVWSEGKIKQERDNIREFFNTEGITDTDILNILIGQEETVKVRFISERGLTEEETDLDIWRVKTWYETYVERVDWVEVLEYGLYGIFGSQTVKVEDGIVVWNDTWGFRNECGIATQERLDKVLAEAKEIYEQLSYKQYEVSTTEED